MTHNKKLSIFIDPELFGAAKRKNAEDEDGGTRVQGWFRAAILFGLKRALTFASPEEAVEAGERVYRHGESKAVRMPNRTTEPIHFDPKYLKLAEEFVTFITGPAPQDSMERRLYRLLREELRRELPSLRDLDNEDGGDAEDRSLTERSAKRYN